MNRIIPMKFSGISSNCYLVQNNDNYVLVDTGSKSKRAKLEKKLLELGCTVGALKLIILTHGDFDHSGNALYLKSKYNCPVGMHREDSLLTESGDMYINKNKKNIVEAAFIKFFLKIDTFKPDLYLDDDMDLKDYGIGAKTIHLPGHSKGSMGILTAENDLICGDLIANKKHPALYYVDDAGEVESSLKKLNQLPIKDVYPGHGDKFKFSDFKNN